MEQQYVVGPEAARRLGYRIDWQALSPNAPAVPLKQVSPQGDSVFLLDDENYLTRLSRKDGQRLWRLSVARPGEEVLGVTSIPGSNEIFVMSAGSVLALDALSGSLVGRQTLEKIANTAPTLRSPYLIYGGRNGQLCWHSYTLAFNWRSYQVSRSITVQPVIEGDAVAVVGTDGRIMVLSASQATQFWSKKLLDEVVAAPVINKGVLYVAATDQYLYALDLRSGRTLWSKLTTSPLTDSPMVIDERVYQQIPGEGLTCFDVLPLDKPGGEIYWQAATVRGNVLTRHRRDLLVWDEGARRLTLVNAADGEVIDSTEVPQARHVMATATTEGNLLAYADDARVIRLLPRN